MLRTRGPMCAPTLLRRGRSIHARARHSQHKVFTPSAFAVTRAWAQKPKCATPPLPQIVCQQLLQQVPLIRSSPMPKTSDAGAAEPLAKRCGEAQALRFRAKPIHSSACIFCAGKRERFSTEIRTQNCYQKMVRMLTLLYDLHINPETVTIFW